MPRFNQPDKGVNNWDEPLNQNFADLALEVTNEVATFSDLPDPTGETSTGEVPRKYLVRENRTIYRDTGSGWEAVAGLGNEGTPVPGTAHFERVRADTFYTVEGTTVADIADAVANNQYVKLQPGVTYTHDGSSKITHGRGDGHCVVDACGATIQVRGNPVVDVNDTGNETDQFYWYGGTFSGSKSAGEVAFDISDSVFNAWMPDAIQECEVGMAFFNESLWCEFNWIQFQAHDNECDVAFIGNDGSPPPGSSLRTPAQNGGTDSFRFSQFEGILSPQQRNLSKGYGIYMSEANLYASEVLASANVDDNVVMWRIHGNLNGTAFNVHSETPGGRQNGTAFVVDKMTRPPKPSYARIGQAGGTTPVINNTSSPHRPLFYYDNALTDNGSDIVGTRLLMDGNVVQQYTKGFTAPVTKVYESDVAHRFKRTGSGANDLAIEIGMRGAGLTVEDGQLVAYDAFGNRTRLT
jgi:hypothetical protein